MSREQGFTLIEVLVAMTVLGAIMTTIYGMVSGQLRSIARADEQVTLALLAQGLLERTALDMTTAGEGATGDGLRWRIERRPVALPPLPPRASAAADADEGSEEDVGGRIRSALEADSESAAADSGSQRERPESGRSAATGTRPPPRLVEVRVTVENGRGRSFSVATMRLEQDPDSGPRLLREEGEPPARGSLLR